MRQMWRDQQRKWRRSQEPAWIKISVGLPVPDRPLLLPAGCSTELSQLLQTPPLLLLLLGHPLSGAEEEPTHKGGWKGTENSAIRGIKSSLHSIPSHALLFQVTNHPMEAQKPATMKQSPALSRCSLTALCQCWDSSNFN